MSWNVINLTSQRLLHINQPSHYNQAEPMKDSGLSSGVEVLFRFAPFVFCCLLRSLALHWSGLFGVAAIVVFAMLLFSMVPVCVCVRTMNKTFFLISCAEINNQTNPVNLSS